jgi:hypothetical protein
VRVKPQIPLARLSRAPDCVGPSALILGTIEVGTHREGQLDSRFWEL